MVCRVEPELDSDSCAHIMRGGASESSLDACKRGGIVGLRVRSDHGVEGNSS